MQKKVGTAAKRVSASIVGWCDPVKLYIENVQEPVVLWPFLVRDLTHPINVGPNFLG